MGFLPGIVFLHISASEPETMDQSLKKAWFAQKKIAWSASVLSRLKTSVRRHKFSFSLLASCVADRVYYLTDDWEKWAPATIWPQTEDGFYICYLNYLERKGFGNEVLTFSPCWLRNQLQEYYQKWIYSYMYINITICIHYVHLSINTVKHTYIV